MFRVGHLRRLPGAPVQNKPAIQCGIDEALPFAFARPSSTWTLPSATMWSTERAGSERGRFLPAGDVAGHEEIGLVGTYPAAGLLCNDVALEARPALATGVLERVCVYPDDSLASGCF